MTSFPSEKKSSTQKEHGSKWQKIIKTIFLSLVWTCLGFYLEIFGPTLKDLKIRTNADYEDVALAVSGRSVGLFLGCIVSGVLVDKLGQYCDLFIALSLDVAAIVTIAVPWSPGVAVLWVCCTIGGVMETIINVAGQRLILNLWLEKSSAPMHLLHAGYGIGSLSVPLYANPFLAVPMPTPVANITNASSNGRLDIGYQNDTSLKEDIYQSISTESTEYLRESRIEYSYGISAALVALLSIVFYYYQMKASKINRATRKVGDVATTSVEKKDIKCNKKQILDNATKPADKEAQDTSYIDKTGSTDQDEREKNSSDETSKGGTKQKTWRDMFNPASCAGGRLWYGIQLLVLLSIYFANANGGERISAGFIRSFSIDQLEFDGDDASYLNTSFWICHTLGRFVFFIAARWVGIRKLVLIETIGITLTTTLLNIFGVNNSTAYWVLTQPLGFFVGPLWPSMIAWADHHIELTGVAMTLFLCAGGIGGLCHMQLMGHLYEHLGSRTFLYQLAGYAVLALILTFGLTIVGARHGNRFKWTNKRKDDNSEPNESATPLDKL